MSGCFHMGNYCDPEHTAMFRPVRLVMMIISASLLLGFTGLRFGAPAPAQAFAGHEQRFDVAMQIYSKLYEFANDAQIPSFTGLYDPGPRPPEVGRPGFSDSSMGQSLADLRERQTGVKTGPMTYSDMINEVQTNMQAFDLDGGASGAPPAQPRRIVVGE